MSRPSPNLADPARTAALRLLQAAEDETRPLDPLLAQLDQGTGLGTGLDRRDVRLARQLTLGCLRWRQRLDWMAGRFSSRPVDELSPWVRQALRLGLYQLFWLDRVPARAAVHTSVELAKRFAHAGAAGLVNAVLRRAQREYDRLEYPPLERDPVAHLACRHSHPEWLIARWLSRWGLEQTEAILRANNEEAPLCVRYNPARTVAVEAAVILAGSTLQAAGPIPGSFIATDAETFLHSEACTGGLFLVQDLNAVIPAVLLAPERGEHVLDLCAAPGGKTAQLAAALGSTGLLVAADLSPSRLTGLRQNAVRLGLTGLRLVAQDARRPALPAPGHPGFDRVLADVPCSATGVLGRHPDARWHRHPEQLPDLVARQEAILASAFAALRPGGVLVYSTCSLEAEENAELVERFLSATPEARLEPASERFPDRAWAGRFVQTLPGREPGDGCFAARLRRETP
ncbi:MAG: 16S rRNA (cytosine(967)-C(5))-methyltransferase RsmB [Candidatus Latescibacterota bacterium]|jgi:16S rRNA (cytosine967-C5)-methyltransferase